MRVLGKPELSNAIRLNELEILMSNFAPQPGSSSQSFELQKHEGKQEKRI